MKSRFVYGPVPSRRLGRSLGIDLVPFKTCSYDCTYCQLGRTTNEASEVRLARTMAELQALGPDLIVPCHCTGDAAVERLRQSFGERVLPGFAGAVFLFQGASASTTKEQT